MKKLLCIILCLITLNALSGCGNQNYNKITEEDTTIVGFISKKKYFFTTKLKIKKVIL